MIHDLLQLGKPSCLIWELDCDFPAEWTKVLVLEPLFDAFIVKFVGAVDFSKHILVNKINLTREEKGIMNELMLNILSIEVSETCTKHMLHNSASSGEVFSGALYKPVLKRCVITSSVSPLFTTPIRAATATIS